MKGDVNLLEETRRTRQDTGTGRDFLYETVDKSGLMGGPVSFAAKVFPHMYMVEGGKQLLQLSGPHIYTVHVRLHPQG